MGDPSRWHEFCEKRSAYLRALADPIQRGVIRRDTWHPLFCGCVDWHSCVHGFYALLTVARLTGEKHWVDVAESKLQPELIDEEAKCVRRGELRHEIPYGYAWLLKLAYERERWWGKADFQVLATEVAGQLARWVFQQRRHDVRRYARSRAYDNISWAVLNLWTWSQWRGDRALARDLESFTRDRLLPLERVLPPSYDMSTEGFFPAALERMRAILTVLDSEESRPWLERFRHNMPLITPVKRPRTLHSAGLNFSRSWGLWALYRATSDRGFRDMYVHHIVMHMSSPEYWCGSYREYGHWVAQFGVYAIALGMETDRA